MMEKGLGPLVLLQGFVDGVRLLRGLAGNLDAAYGTYKTLTLANILLAFVPGMPLGHLHFKTLTGR